MVVIVVSGDTINSSQVWLATLKATNNKVIPERVEFVPALVHHSSKVCVELRGQKPANFGQC